MKKLLTLVLVFVLICQTASADGITFRNIEWGMTAKEAIMQLCDTDTSCFITYDSINTQFPVISGYDEYEHDESATSEISIYEYSYAVKIPLDDISFDEKTYFVTSIYPLYEMTVAGHTVFYMSIYSIGDGDDFDNSRIFMAEYCFKFDASLYDEFSNKLGAVYEDCDMIIIRKDDLAAAISRAMGTPEEDIPQIGTAWVKENTGVAVWMPEEGKEYQEYDLFTVCYWGSKALEDTEKAIHNRLIAESDGL